MSTPLHNLFDIQSRPNVATPAPIYQKSSKQAPQSLQDVAILPDIELDHFATSKGQRTPGQETPNGAQTPRSPNELEMSRPPTPRRDDAVGLMRTWNDEPMTKWRILCCCVIYFANGMNDSVVGALIPYVESWYHISYSIMSLVFVGNAVGFIIAAFFTDTILSKIGRAKTLVLGDMLQLCAYIILVCTPPYPLVVFS